MVFIQSSFIFSRSAGAAKFENPLNYQIMRNHLCLNYFFLNKKTNSIVRNIWIRVKYNLISRYIYKMTTNKNTPSPIETANLFWMRLDHKRCNCFSAVICVFPYINDSSTTNFSPSVINATSLLSHRINILQIKLDV